MPDAPITERAITELLRYRYPAEKGWAFYAQLRAGAGWDRRAIDAFVVGTWESQAGRSIAIEVKISRGDFMRELREPRKRAPWEKLAGECYFATPAGLVKPDELPEGWGLLELRGSKMVQKKAAQQRKPEPWPMSFIGMMLRRTCDAPAELPPALWKLDGRDITEADLDAVTAARFQAQRETIERDARQAGYESGRARHKHAIDLFDAARRLGVGTVDSLQKAITDLRAAGGEVAPTRLQLNSLKIRARRMAADLERLCPDE
jgi:hypothetical protein